MDRPHNQAAVRLQALSDQMITALCTNWLINQADTLTPREIDLMQI